jgi:hypothetical protein
MAEAEPTAAAGAVERRRQRREGWLWFLLVFGCKKTAFRVPELRSAACEAGLVGEELLVWCPTDDSMEQDRADGKPRTRRDYESSVREKSSAFFPLQRRRSAAR